jgi:hypothetical protein
MRRRGGGRRILPISEFLSVIGRKWMGGEQMVAGDEFFL